jgi:hypothetical protein
MLINDLPLRRLQPDEVSLLNLQLSLCKIKNVVFKLQRHLHDVASLMLV